MVEQLTGFRWRTHIDDNRRRPYGDIELMKDARFGYRVLAGGIDGMTVVEPSHTYNGPAAAVWRNFAIEAAFFALEEDMALPPQTRALFSHIELDDDSQDAINAQMSELFQAVFGREPNADDLNDARTLFDAVDGDGSSAALKRAWTILLATLLQDFEFTHY